MSSENSSTRSQPLSGGFDLSDFLENESRVGCRESVGEFSVSNEKALEKLAQYSLVGEYTWLLKLLQTVYLWEPEELEVEQVREFTIFRFCPTLKFPTEGQVIESLQSGLSQKEEPLSQLCLVLRALVGRAGLAFILSINGDKESSEPIYSGDDVSRFSEDDRLGKAYHSGRGIQLFISHFKGNESVTGRLFPTFTSWERRDTMIADILTDNAVFHPIPIQLNGILLNAIDEHRNYGTTRTSRLVIIGELESPSSELKGPKLHLSFTERLVSGSTTSSEPEKADAGVRFLVRAKPPRALRQKLSSFNQPLHEILWLKNGVVVERSTAQGYSKIGQLTLLLSAQEFKTDLSGLAIVVSEERSELQRLAVKAVAQELERIGNDQSLLDRIDNESRSIPEPLESRENIIKNEILPSIGFGFLVSLSLGPALPLVSSCILGGGLAGMLSYGSRRYRESESVLKSQNQKWSLALRVDLRKLGGITTLEFEVSQSVAGAGIQRVDLFQPRK